MVFLLLLVSCATKKSILYMQGAENYNSTSVHYQGNTMQPNDIISVIVGALVPETALVYNKPIAANERVVNTIGNNIELVKLQGYLVNQKGNIDLPVLGTIKVMGKTTEAFEKELVNILKKEGHLLDPFVSVRRLNAKVTILGEVNNPGTYSFTEQFITLPQALGYAGDLTINGKRDDVLLVREVDGIRNILHIDLTTTGWMDDSRYVVKPNDIIVVNPNDAKIRTAGYIGNASTLLGIASVVLSSIILLTR